MIKRGYAKSAPVKAPTSVQAMSKRSKDREGIQIWANSRAIPINETPSHEMITTEREVIVRLLPLKLARAIDVMKENKAKAGKFRKTG